MTAVRKRVGSSFVVGLRMNVEEYLGKSGLEPTEAMAILGSLHKLGHLDYFCVSHSDYHTNQYLLPPDSSGIVAPLAPIGKLAKKIVEDKIPVLVHGSIRNLAKAQEIMDSGSADMVGLVRAQIADAHLINKARSGKTEEIQRCVGANQGCWRRIGRPISCTVNPVTGNEGRYGIAKMPAAAKSKKILVVGGGPGGMKYASTAASFGHDVSLWELDTMLGGNVRHAAQLPDYSMWYRLIEDLSSSMNRNGVKVELGREATDASVVDFGAELTVIATGATWDMSGFSTYRPDTDFIRGIDKAQGRVLDPVAALTQSERCGQHVVIIDDNGDYLPLGVARHLQELGKQVTVVTWDDSVGRKMHSTNEFPFMFPRVISAGVQIVTATYIEQVNEKTVELVGRWTGRQFEIKADTIVLSMLRRANESLYLGLKQAGIDVARVGDCIAPREVDDAILEGFRLAVC
jgi:thioredoxin reductase